MNSTPLTHTEETELQTRLSDALDGMRERWAFLMCYFPEDEEKAQVEAEMVWNDKLAQQLRAILHHLRTAQPQDLHTSQCGAWGTK